MLRHLLAAVLLASFSATASTFSNPVLIPTASDPTTACVTDLNNDGISDLVYLDYSDIVTVHVLIGNGDNTFEQTFTSPPSVHYSRALTVADVNADGVLDLILGDWIDSLRISVLLGNGNGTFKAPIVSSVVANPAWTGLSSNFGVTDFNNDGAVDLVASDSLNYRVFVLLGNNSGSFSLKTTISNFSTPAEVLTGDFDKNGKADFIVHGQLGADATVYLGNGDGTFSAGVRYPGNTITAVQLADMNGDGQQDMVTSTFNQTVDVLLGNSNGTFSYGYSIPAGTLSTLLAVIDVNRDGLLDVATKSELGMSIVLATTPTSFKPPVSYPAYSLFYGFYGGFGDFNGDGKLDYAATVANGIAILPGNGDGSFQSFDFYNVSNGTRGVAVADFNRDNRMDIAASGTAELKVLTGPGSGKFNSMTSAGVTVPTYSLLTADFNADGKQDLFAVESAGVMLGHGDGTFNAPVFLSDVGSFGNRAATVADLNNDGRSDLVITDYESFNVAISQTNGSFAVQRTYMPFSAGVTPAISDLNGDHKLDFLVSANGWIYVYLGNGNGSFQRGQEFPTNIAGADGNRGLASLSLADFDRDGRVDLFGITPTQRSAEVFWGLGNGTFETPILLEMSRDFYVSSAADLDGDGYPDLVLNNDRVISVLPNLGNRQFGPERHYSAGTIQSVVVKDVNADGYPELVVSNGGVSVLMNQPGGRNVRGTFQSAPQPSVDGAPFKLSLNIAGAAVGSPTPTGRVSFAIDGKSLGSADLVGGLAEFTVDARVAIGIHNVTAVYSGDANYLPGTFSADHRVVPLVIATSTALSVSPNPVMAGDTLRLKAVVSAGGNAVASGAVGFYDGTITLGSTLVDETGTAILNTSLLQYGVHQLTAKFLGSSDRAASTSAAISVTVNANSTSTEVQVPASASVGAVVELAASVSSSSGTATGNVTFYDGGTAFQTVQLVAGTARRRVSFAEAGTHNITGRYAANGSFAPSTSSTSQIVVSAAAGTVATSTSLSSAISATGGVELVAHVEAGDGVPVGRVQLVEGYIPIASGVLNRGQVRLTAAQLEPGEHSFRAVYAGTSRYSTSVSPALRESIGTREVGDFSVSASASAISDFQGRALVRVSIASRQGFSGPVDLRCNTSEPGVHCFFSPAVLNGGKGTSVLTVVTPLTASAKGLGLIAVFFALMMPVLFAGISGKRTRTWLLGFLCVASGLLVTSGCGSGSVSTRSALQAYVVTIEASSQRNGSPLIHSVQVIVRKP